MTASCRRKIFASAAIDGSAGSLRATSANSSRNVNRSWNLRSSFMAPPLCEAQPARRQSIARAIGSRLFRRRLGRGGGRGRLRGGTLGCFSRALPVAGLRQAGTDLGNLAEIEQCVVRGVVMVEHAEINFALIRERANERDRRRGDGQVAARMRVP